MPYVKCSNCKNVVHFKPVDLTEFNKRFVEGNEPIYCLDCFKKQEKEPKTECKICGSAIVKRCKCMRNDVTCKNGHSYHWSPFHQEYHEGMSDHSTDTLSPDCCKEKKKL